MRWAELTAFGAFCEGSVETPLTYLSDNDDGFAVVRESERLSADGSMSGMLMARVSPKECAL